MTSKLPYVKTTVPVLQPGEGRGSVPGVTGPDSIETRPYGDIAQRIRWHRALEGARQEDYAARAGIKRTQLNNWENGNHRISIDGALALRRTYGLSLDFIYEGIDDALSMTLRQAWRDKP